MSVELNNDNRVKSPASGLLGDEFFDAEDGDGLKISDDELLSKINKELSDIPDSSKVESNGFEAANIEQCQSENEPQKNDEKMEIDLEDETSTISLSKQLEEDNIEEQASAEKEFEELLDLVSDVKSKTKDDDDLLDDLSDIEDVDSKANEIEAKIDALLSEGADNQKLSDEDEIAELGSLADKIVEPKADGISEAKADNITELDTKTAEIETSPAEIPPEDEPMLEEPVLEATTEKKSVEHEEASLKEHENPATETVPTIAKTEDAVGATKDSTNAEPSKDSDSNAAKESELLEDDLLEDCASSDMPAMVIDNVNGKPSESETSSSNGDTPEESDAEKQSLNQVDNNAATDAADDSITEKMDIDMCLTGSLKPDDKLLLCVVMEEEEKPKKDILKLEPSQPIKFNFMRKFASKIGKLSRSELEELLVQKIAEAMVFSTDNSDLRTRIENQEKLNDSVKKQLENVKKQYKDLQMIHDRVMKDLKERPEAPITPVKITRAVGLQVYQPALRGGKNTTPPQSTLLVKRSHESPVNGTSPPDAKRKKTVKTTPLRPPLSDKARAALARQEATEELKLRTKTMKTVMNVNVPSSITVVPLNSLQNGNKGSSIDLTDDMEEGSSNKTKPHQPPPLTAIRAAMAAGKSVPVPKMPTAQPVQVRQNQVRIPYNVIAPNIAPLPATPAIASRPGWKRIPPRPVIKISKVNSGIIVSWFLENLSPEQHANILSYQIYAYEQSSNGPALTENWRHVGDVKALALPMAVTLTQFQEGRKYYFAVRAQDCHKRFTGFSLPRTWA